MHPIPVDQDLRLDPLRPGHASVIFHLIDANRAHLRPWLPFVDQTQRVEDSARFIQALMLTPSHQRETIALIRYQETYVGLIGTRDTDRVNRKTEIGYWIAQAYEGRGIVRRACAALIHHAFTHMELNCVRIRCGVGNHRSAAIPRRLGFCLEGIERAGEWLYDHFHDLEVYSLLKEEWRMETGGPETGSSDLVG